MPKIQSAGDEPFNYEETFKAIPEDQLQGSFAILNQSERAIVHQALSGSTPRISLSDQQKMQAKVKKYVAGKFSFVDKIKALWARLVNFLSGGVRSQELLTLAKAYTPPAASNSLVANISSQIEQNPGAEQEKAAAAPQAEKIQVKKVGGWTDQKIAEFNKELEDIISKQLSAQPAAIQSNLPELKVDEASIEALMASLPKTTTVENQQIFAGIDQMNEPTLKAFLAKLDGENFENLWTYLVKEEFEPSKKERHQQRLEKVFTALSDAQVNALIKIPKFLTLMSQDIGAVVVAKVFNRQQLAALASDPRAHQALAEIIRKLPPDEYRLGKVVSILPYATDEIMEPLKNQIVALQNGLKIKDSPKFVGQLERLARHYAKENKKKMIASKATAAPNKPLAAKAPVKKHATVKATAQPVYAKVKIESAQRDWTDGELSQFLGRLSDSTALSHQEDAVRQELNTMNAPALKKLLELSNTTESVSHLTNLWLIDAKAVNLTEQTHRQFRLGIILENLSDLQLLEALKTENFLKILKDDQQGSSEAAAKVFSSHQFGLIAVDRSKGVQQALIELIKKLEKSDKLESIIRVLIERVSPWTALALDRKITSSFGFNKEQRAELQKELREKLALAMRVPQELAEWDMNAAQAWKAEVARLIPAKPST